MLNEIRGYLFGCIAPGSAITPKPPNGLPTNVLPFSDPRIAIATDFTPDYQSPDSVSIAVSGLPDEWDIAIHLSGETLKLSRGRFGRITLFTARVGDYFWFSNRLDVLLLWSGLPRTIDHKNLRSFTSFSWFPAPFTPVEGVMALKPGEELTLSLTPVNQAPSQAVVDGWGEFQAPVSDLNGARDTLQKMLLDEAERQTRDLGRETAGVLLSGGLDSSLTAAALVRNGARVRAYCLDFGDNVRSEIEYAEAVAAHLGVPLTLIPCGPKEVLRALEQTIRSLDLPYGDGVSVPLFIGSQRVSNECSVIFNGEGGDQLFAGWTNKPLFADSIYGNQSSLVESYLRTFHRFREVEKFAFAPDLVDSKLDDQLQTIVENALREQHPEEPLIHRLRRANLRLKGAQNIQPRATAAGVSNRLRVRSLFCSNTIADWTFGLRPEWFLHNSHEKYILKLAVSGWLPDKIVWREKRGMGVPLTSWLTGPMWKQLGVYLHPQILLRGGVWQADLPLRLASGNLGAHIQGRRIGELFWLMLSLQAWLGDSSLKASPFLFPLSFWRTLLSTSRETTERLWTMF